MTMAFKWKTLLNVVKPKAREEKSSVYLEEDNERSKSNFSSAKRRMSGGEKSSIIWGLGLTKRKHYQSLQL